MSDGRHAEVPIGINAGAWNTIAPDRTVLAVAHNVTTLTRMLDVLPVFDSDFRVQVVFSWSGSDPFRHGVAELLERMGVLTIPWEQAKLTRFDLALAASHHGGLADLNSPLVIVSHGIGYTKNSPETGNRKPETGNRKPETARTFGLSAQWVLYDGRPFASALVLSHDEQFDRLAAAVPEAAPVATVAGDPCYDRILASRQHRARYRAALGTGDRTLVMVSSTWGPRSLLGSWPDLVRRLLAELPMDSFQVVAALHPNIWHGHGPRQVRCWLADCVRSGLTLLPEIDGWRTGLIASDVLIGDHGSVTGYGAALGVPTALAAFPDEDVASGSPIAALGRTAPRLDPSGSLLRQVGTALDADASPVGSAVAPLVTSYPGEALARLRSVCYEIMHLPEPPGEPPLLPLSPTEIPEEDRPPESLAFRAEYTVDVDTRTVRLGRWPVELGRESVGAGGDSLLCAPADHPLQTVRASTTVLTCFSHDLSGSPESWFDQTLTAGPGTQAAAALDGHGATLRTRDGRQVHARATSVAPEVVAAACWAWLSTAPRRAALPNALTAVVAGSQHEIDLTPGSDR